MLSLEQLTSPLLPTVSFTAKPGQCICISGESGSGKTLLLRAIADLDPSSGSVTLNGDLRESLSADLWRRRVTYLPAESQWWSADVKDHFTANDTEFTKLGFPKEVGNWQVARLSSGERQRLALLRALDHTPQVLLLDEITANLDEENTLRVEQLIADRIKQGLIVIWVSHDKQQRQRIATKSYLIRDGEFMQEDANGTG